MALLVEIPAVAPVRVSDPPLAICRPVAAALSPTVNELVVLPPSRIAVLIWTGLFVARSMVAVSAALLGNTPADQFAPSSRRWNWSSSKQRLPPARQSGVQAQRDDGSATATL